MMTIIVIMIIKINNNGENKINDNHGKKETGK